MSRTAGIQDGAAMATSSRQRLPTGTCSAQGRGAPELAPRRDEVAARDGAPQLGLGRPSGVPVRSPIDTRSGSAEPPCCRDRPRVGSLGIAPPRAGAPRRRQAQGASAALSKYLVSELAWMRWTTWPRSTGRLTRATARRGPRASRPSACRRARARRPPVTRPRAAKLPSDGGRSSLTRRQDRHRSAERTRS